MAEKQRPSELRIAELESDAGKAEELPPQDRARLRVAGQTLLGVAAFTLLSGAALVFAPDNRVTQAEAMFEFVKTIAPPLVTLIIGFYFRNENS